MERKSGIPISLRDVARAAGVSVGTASQAMRGVGSTSLTTRQRIRRIADALGYRPDVLMSMAGARHAVGRRGGSGLLFGLLEARSAAHQERYPFIRFSKACEERAMLEGCDFVRSNVTSVPSLRRKVREWYHRGVRGIVLSHWFHQEWLGEVDWSPFALVYLGGKFEAPFVTTVCLDFPRALALTLSKALEEYDRVGVMLRRDGDQPIFDDLLRLGVAEDRRASFPSRVSTLTLPFRIGTTSFAKMLRSWLREARPEALIGFPIDHSQLAEVRRKRLPFFFCAGNRVADGCAGVEEPVEELARFAIRTLTEKVRRHELGIPHRPELILIPPAWTDRRR